MILKHFLKQMWDVIEFQIEQALKDILYFDCSQVYKITWLEIVEKPFDKIRTEYFVKTSFFTFFFYLWMISRI